MAVANCPECQEEVSLPSASEEATVQCPLCGAEYVLSTIINALPPALIVLDDPLAGSPEVDRNDELNLAPAEEVAVSNSAFAFDEEAAPGKALLERAAARGASSGSPVKTIVQIFLGGALALPLAQLVLWHLPEEPRDPVGLGEAIYANDSLEFLRSIVPAELDASGSSDDSSNGDDESAEQDVHRPLTNPLQQDTGFNVGPMEEVELGSGTPLGNPFGVDENPEENPQPTIDEIAAQPKPAGPAPLSPTEYIRASIVFQNVVINSMYAQAQDSLKQWDELGPEANENLRKVEGRELFLSLGQLASGITYQDPDMNQSFEAVENAFKFFSELAGREEILDLVNAEFENSLRTKKSPLSGVLFTAHSVGEEESVSGYQRLMLELDGGALELPLVYSPEIAQPISEDTSSLVLGSLIRRPRQDLKNYLGTDEFVIIFGAAVPLAVNPQ